MATINISIPESMKSFIEQRIAADEFTASEYFRHLVRKDQHEWEAKRRDKIAEYLALCEQQIAEGKSSKWDYKEFIAEVESAYKKRNKKKGNRS